MENSYPTINDLLIETHINLERQGPGSPEIVLKVLSFLDDPEKIIRAADLACGTGGQTMVLAQNISGCIVGVDICPQFIDKFNTNAEKLNLQDKVKGIVGSMEDLSFRKNELDLVWSEGAIDTIGFERGLAYWNGFLKMNGYIAVSCPAWLTDERPAEMDNFWKNAGGNLEPISNHISVMFKTGYNLIAAFVIPEYCWVDNYFIPREIAGKNLLKKYPGNKIVETHIKDDIYEKELYLRYRQYYGYVFYIGKKYK